MAETKNPQAGAPGTETKKKVSLQEKLLALTFLSLRFVGLSHTKDKDGNYIAVLQLAEPIPLVVGSQEVDFNGVRHRINATDVKEIKVHQRNFTDEFTFDRDTDTGSYEGSKLMLDVSKNGGGVWLVSESFASAGRTYSNERRNERTAKLLKLAPAAENTSLKPTAEVGG